MAKQKKPQDFFTTTQPREWQDAFRAEADRQGKSVSEWAGEAMLAALPAKVRSQLPPRPPKGRPVTAEK
jgi:hypothetical protein